MQAFVLLHYLGWILLLIGILLVCISVISATKDSASEDSETRIESKGIIFLGPIPIVWGYGKKGWIIAGAIGIIFLLIWIVFFI